MAQTKQKEVVAEYSDQNKGIELTLRVMAQELDDLKAKNVELNQKVEELCSKQTKKSTTKKNKAKPQQKAMPSLAGIDLGVVNCIKKQGRKFFFKKLGANITQAEPSEYTRKTDGKVVAAAIVSLDNGDSYTVTAQRLWKNRD